MADNLAKRKAAVLDEVDGDGKGKHSKSRRISTPTRRSARLQSRLFRFMDLPQELQDLVYHELWLDSPIIRITSLSLRDVLRVALRDGIPMVQSVEPDINTQSEVRLRYHNIRGCPEVRGFPQWLLANKTILNKGLKQLQDNMTVSWSAEEHGVIELKARGKTPHLPLQLKTSSLIDIFAATKFQLSFTASDNRKYKVIRTPHTTGQSIQALMHAIHPNIKSLDLAMLYTPDDEAPFVNLQDPLRPLHWMVVVPLATSNVITKSLPRAETLRISLGTPGHDDGDAFGKEVKASLERECTRLSRRLVGWGAKVEVTDKTSDWPDGAEGRILDYRYRRDEKAAGDEVLGSGLVFEAA